MQFIILTKHKSTLQVAVNVSAISQIECLVGNHVAPHAHITRVDGGSVEVSETYEEVLLILETSQAAGFISVTGEVHLSP